jgi:hypothetical protein
LTAHFYGDQARQPIQDDRAVLELRRVPESLGPVTGKIDDVFGETSPRRCRVSRLVLDDQCEHGPNVGIADERAMKTEAVAMIEARASRPHS